VGAGERESDAMTLRRALSLVVFQALFLFVARLALSAWQGQPENALAPSASTFATLALTSVVTVGVVWWGSIRGRGWSDAGWRFERPVQTLALALGVALVCLAIVVALVAAAGGSASEVLEAMARPSLAQRAVYAGIGAQAAFTEETLFRGNLLGALEKRLPWWPAVLVMAVSFSLYHLIPSPLGLAAKFVFGVVFALARRWSGSLVAPALGHFLFWTVAGAA